MATNKNVYKEEVSKIKIPSIAEREDRGLSLCANPFLVLADPTDSRYWRNDRTGVAFKVDTLTVELENENGTLFTAPGTAIDFPHQSDAKGFVIDWRQLIIDGVGLRTGCYKIKVTFEKSGISGNFYYGSYRLLPYTAHTSEGTSRLFVVLNDYVREDGINYKKSGFANTVRFKGKFGYMQPNVEIENLTKVNRIREKIRNEALRTYELRTDYMLSCLTQKIDNEHLLAASQIYISDYNKDNHVEYKDFPVILDESKTYEYNYSEGTPYASIQGYFLDKRAYYESKYDGDIPAKDNVILDLPQGVVGGACADATINVDSIKLADVNSGGTLDIQVVDSEDNPVDVTLASPKIIVNDLPCKSLEEFPYVGLNNLLDPNNAFCWESPLTQAQSVVGFQPWNLLNSVGFDATTNMWTLNGVDQYFESVNALNYTNKRNALSFHIFLNSNNTSIQPLIVNSTSSSSDGSVYIYRSLDNLIFRYYNSGGSLTNTIFTDFFVGFNGVNFLTSVVIDYDTGDAHAYRNGVLFATETHTAVKPTGATNKRIGRVGGLYGEFKFGVHAMYNDMHDVSKILRFFNEFKTDYGL